jgi:hypothetical protein
LAKNRAEHEARWARARAQWEQLERVEEQQARARAEAEARVDDGAQPSTHTRDYWLWVDRKPEAGAYPEDTERVGKWMVFVPVARVDEWWARIKAAAESGQLGQGAKVATARPNPNAISAAERVIIVYTYDGLDKDDVMRVREALRALGVTWPISYKLDSATLAGQYARTGARVSLYRV